MAYPKTCVQQKAGVHRDVRLDALRVSTIHFLVIIYGDLEPSRNGHFLLKSRAYKRDIFVGRPLPVRVPLNFRVSWRIAEQ